MVARVTFSTVFLLIIVLIYRKKYKKTVQDKYDELNQKHTLKDICMFCSIAANSNKRTLYEDEDMFLVQDVAPRAAVHLLMIPKRHIKNIWALREQDKALLDKMKKNVLKVLKKDNDKELTIGFHNPYFTTINHVHMHIIGGKRSGLRYWLEFGNNFVFKSFTKVHNSLTHKMI
ncbi:unnamed protein product [Moneuplotes crassus]|uniref:HIT domain-containing protein n=1 Tax=Euplotes crassus TaxID=5936 RepID=A0AAD2D5B3_EUPCR|nr:unnamed protein product [Moneuplotes crassus]